MRRELTVTAAVLGMVVEGGEDDPLGCPAAGVSASTSAEPVALSVAEASTCASDVSPEGNMGELLTSTAGGL
jgi:hypothetical protein